MNNAATIVKNQKSFMEDIIYADFYLVRMCANIDDKRLLMYLLSTG